ncbi:MAG TPA: MFS transporter [Acholeplasmataceae bacterium]|nr:MFS transporter [Acholeplasmataceae bacterium]
MNMKHKGYVITSVILMLLIGSVYTYSVFRPFVEDRFTLNTLQSGLPYMLSLFFYALSMMLTGRILTTKNQRMILIIGILLIGLGWFLAGFASHFMIFLMGYGVMIGVGVGMVYGIPIKGIQDRFPLKKGLMTGLVLLGFGLSTLIVAPLSTYLIETYGLSQTFYIYAMIFMIVLVPISLILGIHQDASEVSNIQENQKILNVSSIKLYLYFVMATTIGLMMIGLSYYIGVTVYGFNPWSIALSMSLFAVMNGISRPIFGWLMDRKGFYYSVKLSLLLIISASVISIINQGTHLVLFMISYGIFWFNLGAWLAIIPAAVSMKYGRERYAKQYGLFFTGYGIGAIIGTLLSGFIMDLFGNTTYIYLIILVFMIGLWVSTMKPIKN